MASSFTTRLGKTTLRHLRAVRPLDFPSSEPWEEKLGESTRHRRLCALLVDVLVRECTPAHTVGGNQFIYWNARDPKRTCAPDAFVKLGVPDEEFESWKTWLFGAPELVVEILSKHDREPLTWNQKFERFHELGAREVVRFDMEPRRGRSRLRVWDRIDDDLVERAIVGEVTPCLTLGLFWIVAPGARLDAVPRLSRDAKGRDVLWSEAEAAMRALSEAETARAQSEAARAESEAARAQSEAARAESEAARVESEAARESAEARVAALEAELGKRGR